MTRGHLCHRESPPPSRLREGYVERLGDLVDEDELQAAELVLGYLSDVSLVALRNDHLLDPCPLCGATVSGDDPRRGICRYPDPSPIDYGLRIVLVDRRTGEIV